MPPLYHRVWQYLKYMVNHDENTIPMRDGSKLLIKKGQHLTSVRDIAKSIGWYEGVKWKEPNPKTVSVVLDWLEKQGMITIERGKGNRQYTLISLLNWEKYQFKNDKGNSKVTDREHLVDINKNDKECFKNDLKDSTTTAETPAPKEYNFYQTFQRAFGRVPTPLQSQDICNYIDQDGLEERLICYGLEKASKAGKDYGYAARIFGIWKSKGILTYDAGVKEQEQFERQKVVQQPKKNVKKDKLPEWIEDQRTQKESHDQADITEEQKRERMEKLLKSLGEWDEEKERGYG
jgi:DnaD/phage-associated family protein